MRFDLKISPEGDLRKAMLQEILAAEIAVTRGVRVVADGLKRDWRGQVRASGLGARLANAVRSNVYPNGTESIRAASLVYAQPNQGLGASAAEVLDAHDRGALIRSERGFWLAVPIAPDVQKMRARDLSGRGNYRITPSGWELKTGRRLELVPRPGRHPLLVDTGIPLARRPGDTLDWQSSRYKKWVAGGRKRSRIWKPIFVLVPQTKLRKKMDLDRASDAWGDRLPGAILENWREVGRG